MVPDEYLDREVRTADPSQLTPQTTLVKISSYLTNANLGQAVDYNPAQVAVSQSALEPGIRTFPHWTHSA